MRVLDERALRTRAVAFPSSPFKVVANAAAVEPRATLGDVEPEAWARLTRARG